jgi:hypothetical protein
MNPSKGFFEKLFDFSFSSFIAPQIVGVLYILGLVGGALFALVTIFGAFSFGFLEGIATLVGAMIGLLIYAIFLRVSLESFIAIVRTAENTRILAENAISQRANGDPSP